MEQEPERRSLAEARQMRAWFARARPDEYERWDEAMLGADLADDVAGYDRLEGAMIAQWREHRDDPLPPQRRRPVELAQSVAWLGHDQGLAWRHAHALAVSGIEHDSDIDRLILRWRGHRDDPGLPDSVTEHVSSLLRVREARLAEAKAWYQDHHPRALSLWEQRRGYADTLADEWLDDRTLIRSWLHHTATASATTGRGAHREATTQAVPRRGPAQAFPNPSRFDASPRSEVSGPAPGPRITDI